MGLACAPVHSPAVSSLTVEEWTGAQARMGWAMIKF